MRLRFLKINSEKFSEMFPFQPYQKFGVRMGNSVVYTQISSENRIWRLQWVKNGFNVGDKIAITKTNDDLLLVQKIQ